VAVAVLVWAELVAVLVVQVLVVLAELTPQVHQPQQIRLQVAAAV
jgi:hypothetical protein